MSAKIVIRLEGADVVVFIKTLLHPEWTVDEVQAELDRIEAVRDQRHKPHDKGLGPGLGSLP